MKRFLTMMLLTALFLTSCKTVPPQRSWSAYSGKLNWTLNLYEKNQAELILPLENRAVVQGELFEEEPGIFTFYMDRLSWFGSWHEGWTEAVFSMSGSLRLSSDGQTEFLESPEIIGVESAQIRYHEDRFYADQAADMLRRRWTRTQRSIELFRRLTEDRSYALVKENHYNPSELMADYQNIYFPEVFEYDAEFPPVKPELQDSSRWQRGELIRWDTLYSAEYFPEDMQPVRSAGTLFRDYEEGRQLLFLEYLWPRIWETPPALQGDFK